MKVTSFFIIVVLLVFILCPIYSIDVGDTWTFSVLGYYLTTLGDKTFYYFIPDSAMDMSYHFSTSDSFAQLVSEENTWEDPTITEIEYTDNSLLVISKKNGKKEIGALWEVSLVFNDASADKERQAKEEENQRIKGNYSFSTYDPIKAKIYLLHYVNSKRKEVVWTFTQDKDGYLYSIVNLKVENGSIIEALYKVNINGSKLPSEPTDIEYINRVSEGIKSSF